MASAPLADLPSSPVYDALARIERATSAERVNEICNHAEVRPWLGGNTSQRVDLAPIISRPENVVLLGEFGAIVFMRGQPGLYEAHTQILPEGRGQWALNFAQACLHWMFCRHDAMEVATRVPDGNLGAKGLARGLGFRKEFVRHDGYRIDGEAHAAEIYFLTLQAWQATAPGLVERGIEFHESLDRQGKKSPTHPEDANHDRYVGATMEMVRGGQVAKAMVFYNRWAFVVGFPLIGVISWNPLIIDVGNCLLRVDGNDFTAMGAN